MARYAGLTGRDTARIGWYAALSAWKLAVHSDYQHRLAQDSYSTDPAQAPRVIASAERFLSKGVA